MASNGAESLPFHEKSDTEKDDLYKTVAARLDLIATDIELRYSAKLKTGQLLYR